MRSKAILRGFFVLFCLTDLDPITIITPLFNVLSGLGQKPLGFPVTAQKENSYRKSWLWALAFTLPVIVLCGGLAGYFMSSLLVHQMGAPEILAPALTGLGVLGAAAYCGRLIQRFNEHCKIKK